MQTKDMWNRNKWRVVAGAATLTALGITGLALAETGDDNLEDGGISLLEDDLVTMDTFESPDEVVVDDTGAVSDLDSPLDDDVASVAGAEDSPDDGTETDSPDSPDDATETDSPDDVDSPAETDSPDDVDSPAEADSPDEESPDSPDDSP